jgi:hypothetical protein
MSQIGSLLTLLEGERSASDLGWKAMSAIRQLSHGSSYLPSLSLDPDSCDKAPVL